MADDAARSEHDGRNDGAIGTAEAKRGERSTSILNLGGSNRAIGPSY